MKVEVILTADEKLLNVLDKFANALSVLHNVKPSVDESASVAEVETPEAPQVEQPTVEVPKTAVETKEPPKVESEPNVAKKTLYFQHEGTGEIIKVAKGESLDFLDGPEIFDERTKGDYDVQQAEIAEQHAAEQVAAEQPVAEAKPTVVTETQKTEEPQTNVPDAPTLRAAAKKLMEAGKQAELKATLNGFTDASGEPVQKLSGLQDADKAKFITAVHELLGE